MSPRRRTIAAVLVGIGAVVYGASPIDALPELILGPLGYADDVIVLITGAIGIWKLLKGRRGPVAGGTTSPPPAV